ADDAGGDRIVVMEDALRAWDAYPSEEDGRVLGLDVPIAPGDGVGGVDDGEVDLRLGDNAIQKGCPVGGRLGEDGGHAHGAAVGAGEPAKPAVRLAPRRAGSAPLRSPSENVSGKRRIEPDRSRSHARARRPRQ